MPITPDDVQIELVTSKNDIHGIWDCMYQSFGVQTKDAFFEVLYPRLHTPQGYTAGLEMVKKDWLTDGKNSTTKFWLKATVPMALDATITTTATTETSREATQNGARKIVGATIWTEALHSRNPPCNDVTKNMNLEELYPGDEREQRFLKQIYASLYGHRMDVVREAGEQGRPVLILDLCCIQPDYQGLGIGRKLVQWGLDFASEQGEKYGEGTLECYTEGSVMGRPVYERMGFKAESEVEFVVDDEFKDRRTAPNTHLRRPRGLPV